ncbi:phage tail protein, partial [Methanosarcina mazei]|uniref:phage tail protein n=1 Tax=Methanosarcina mazei TaxID=2209 RepID=UPI00064F74A8
AIFNTIAHLNLLNAGKTIIKTLGQGLSGMTGNIVNIIKNLVKKIIDNFKNIDWIGVGKNIIGGITNGIKSMAVGLAQSAKDAAKGALNGAKDYLGIKSPSRVFRDEVGKMIGAGMAEGIADSARQVNSAMQGLNNQLQVESSTKTDRISNAASKDSTTSSGNEAINIEIHNSI